MNSFHECSAVLMSDSSSRVFCPANCKTQPSYWSPVIGSNVYADVSNNYLFNPISYLDETLRCLLLPYIYNYNYSNTKNPNSYVISQVISFYDTMWKIYLKLSYLTTDKKNMYICISITNVRIPACSNDLVQFFNHY